MIRLYLISLYVYILLIKSVSGQSWSFNYDSDGWFPFGSHDDVVVEDGLLVASSSHKDGPKIRITGLNFLAVDYTHIIIRLKTDESVNGQPKTVRVFWNALSLERAVYHNYIAESDEFITLRIEVGNHPGWTGIINAIRLDLCFQEGKRIEVDYISMERSSNPFSILTSYTIRNKSSMKSLDVKNASVSYRAAVVCSSPANLLSQQWLLTPDDNSQHFFIKNINSSKVLNADTNDRAEVTGINHSTPWVLQQDDNGLIKIIHFPTGKVLAIDGDNVITQEEQPGDHQLWIIEQSFADYPVPEPVPVNTGHYLVGVLACNLWNPERNPWEVIKPFPERRPVLDWYVEGTKVITDWEIKMLVDHGVNFIMPCWWRKEGNQGQPVEGWLDHFFQSIPGARYSNYLKFAINWTNNKLNVSSEDDFLNNLVTYWANEYFSKENYLKIDGKPVISIYDINNLISDLGGEEQTRIALQKAEQLMISKGFNGIIFWGQYCWGSPFNNNRSMKNTGLSYSFPYHLPTFMQVLANKPTYTAAEIIEGHKMAWNNQNKHSLVPNIINITMGWDSEPWNNFVSSKKWRLSPAQFRSLALDAKNEMDKRPADRLDSKIILIDNWNEFGEGHYIMPTEQYGFGYLLAIKSVFMEQTVNIPIQDSILQNDFIAYPNPAKDYFQLNGMIDKPVLVELISMQGFVVFRSMIYNQHEKIDISALPKGIYLLRTDDKVSKLLIQ